MVFLAPSPKIRDSNVKIGFLASLKIKTPHHFGANTLQNKKEKNRKRPQKFCFHNSESGLQTAVSRKGAKKRLA